MSLYKFYQSNSRGVYVKEVLLDICRELREDGTVTILPLRYFSNDGQWNLVDWRRNSKPKYRFTRR